MAAKLEEIEGAFVPHVFTATRDEVVAALMPMDLPASHVETLPIDEITMKLIQVRMNSRGCLDAGGSGVTCWIKSRLMEMRCMPDVGCLSGENINHISGVFHFWTWDEDTHGPWTEIEHASSRQKREEARSPIDRLLSPNGSPINSTTAKVTGS